MLPFGFFRVEPGQPQANPNPALLVLRECFGPHRPIAPEPPWGSGP